MYEVSLAENPYSIEALDQIPKLKTRVEKVLKDAGVSNAEDRLWIGGETASLYDTKQITERDEAVIIPVMISIIALLLLVYLRSIVAMIYLIVTVVLSFFLCIRSRMDITSLRYGSTGHSRCNTVIRICISSCFR